MALKEKFIVICSSPRNERHSRPGRPQGGAPGSVRGQKRMRARPASLPWGFCGKGKAG